MVYRKNCSVLHFIAMYCRKRETLIDRMVWCYIMRRHVKHIAPMSDTSRRILFITEVRNRYDENKKYAKRLCSTNKSLLHGDYD